MLGEVWPVLASSVKVRIGYAMLGHIMPGSNMCGHVRSGWDILGQVRFG
jgi:hypothetical protein